MTRWMVVACSLCLISCNQSSSPPTPLKQTPSALRAHSELFKQGVVSVTDRVHVAIGYGLANSIMIEGDSGIIIVDTMETVEQGQAVLAAFRKITDKPVKAIIYTHNHTDHVFGSAAFAAPGEVPVYAHQSTQYYINRVVNQIRPIITTRSMRMFGSHLSEEELVNAGIGPFLGVQANSQMHALRPTHTFQDSLKVNIDGVNFELVHAPGETEDQLFVWLPEERVLLPGDNIYQAFPNLYTIRGTYYRDLTQWVASLDRMRLLAADYLVPSHSRPIVGKERVAETLRLYRDGIQFVHDQTLRYMNQGLTADEIVERLRLPEHLANHPYLQEFYGSVAWSVRSVFNGYLGWFDGNPTRLNPLAPDARAARMLVLAGGEQKLLTALEQALQQEDYAWALELSDTLMHTASRTQARALKARALRALAENEANPNARHYYFTLARELEDEQFSPAIYPKPPIEFVRQLPLDNIFHSMAVFLRAEDTLDVTLTAEFHFTDTEQVYAVQIRQGIAEVQAYSLGPADILVTTRSDVWKAIAAQLRSPASAVLTGDLKVPQGKLALLRFLSYFDLPKYD